MAKHHVRDILVIGNLAFVALTQGRVAIVDAADAHLVSGDNWQACIHPTNNYAGRSQWAGDRYVKIKMHRVLMDAPDGLQVDHIDGDGLNNRRCNLRLVTNMQNCWNQRVAVNNTSGYRGVSFHTRRACWQANIRVNGKLKHLGRFETSKDASAAYDAAALKAFGEFARISVG